MVTIQEIYTHYQIMPVLQQHMLRVAGVTDLICQLAGDKVDSHNVVIAALLHDSGNIIKFDLQRFPHFLEPEGLDYWLQAQT